MLTSVVTINCDIYFMIHKSIKENLVNSVKKEIEELGDDFNDYVIKYEEEKTLNDEVKICVIAVKL